MLSLSHSKKKKKKKFFKIEMDLFCLSLSTLASRRVCKVLFVFPSVLPIFKSLSKIDEVCEEKYQNSLPKCRKKSKLLKNKKKVSVSFSIY